jgi:hypothetical protein
MRLCAVLAVVLVALVVVTFKVVRRHPHHVAPSEADVVEIAPPPPPVGAAPPRTIVRRAPPRIPAAPVPPAAIRGRLRVSADDGDDDKGVVEIVARPSGVARAYLTGKAGEDGFVIEGLVSGARYDLEFRGDHVRTLTMIGIVAPAEDVDVALERRATIRVAVGFPRGQRCPIDSVFAYVGAGDDGEGGGIVGSDDECRFDFDAPVSAGLVTIVAEGADVRFEAALLVPDHGDPEPICLNPPCWANPLDGVARLRFILDGAAAGTGINADVVPTTPGANTRYACRSSSIPTCEIDGLPSGEMYTFTVGGDRCGAGPMTISLWPGDNDVSVPCIQRAGLDEELGAEIPDPAPADDGA